MFVEEFKRSGGVWIMKPIGSAQGRGIFLFSRLSEISEWRTDPYRHLRDQNDKDAAPRAEPEAYPRPSGDHWSSPFQRTTPAVRNVAAATRLRGIATSRPRRRRDS